nr:MAG TPA: hypothetical protein [Caudoviricetes sp.]
MRKSHVNYSELPHLILCYWSIYFAIGPHDFQFSFLNIAFLLLENEFHFQR